MFSVECDFGLHEVADSFALLETLQHKHLP